MIKLGPIIALPRNWYTFEIAEGVDCKKPGIYEWRIERVGVYIGRYSDINRPTKAYTRNVANHLNGLPYRKNKPDQYRRIHRELARAWNERLRVTLTIIENVETESLNRRERELIAERGTLNGRLLLSIS